MPKIHQDSRFVVPLPERGRGPLTDAYLANLELMRLQNEYPLLRTIEEKKNNVTKQQRCMDTINAYLCIEYLKTLHS